MKTSNRILLFFIILALITTMGSLMAIIRIRDHYVNQYLAKIQQGVTKSANDLTGQIDQVYENLFRLSISKQSNLLSHYNREKDFSLIYEKLEIIFSELQVIKAGYPFIDSITIFLPSQNRQITDSRKYDSIDFDKYEELQNLSNTISISENTMNLTRNLAASLASFDSSLVNIQLSIDRLIQDVVKDPSADIEVSYCIIDGVEKNERQTEFNTWSRQGDYYCFLMPISFSQPTDRELILSVSYTGSQIKYIDMQLVIWAVGIAIILALAVSVFAYLLKHLIGHPLNILIDSFDSVSKGDTKKQITYMANNEFSEIYNHFNSSIRKLDSLITQEYQSRIAAQQAEIKYLQVQIQPHFLYNSFYQMYRICKAGDTDTATDYAALLSQYYEYIAHDTSGGNDVTLKEEIEQSDRYIKIQQVRYLDQLNVEFDIDNSAINTKIPKLIIQPIVENSVKHCLEFGTANHLLIKISVYDLNDSVMLVIEDNGSQLSDKDIEFQAEKLRKVNDQNTISGLANINLRLILSKRSSGIVLSRSTLGGLKVAMSFKKTSDITE